ncbi:integral membrane protein [Colletotrichum salicis]|uniref:Integral membrane protein n=1 Tax=Colletotrichum salicis TaxID=1209931 RepID=A0A135V219_9PEZI|nr:integral membrane protein [Colletotrichum salicis]
MTTITTIAGVPGAAAHPTMTELAIVAIALNVVAMLACAGRLWRVHTIRRRCRLDDALIISALVFASANTIIRTLIATHSVPTILSPSMSPKLAPNGMAVLLLDVGTNNLCLLLTKTAVFSFYLPILFDRATTGLVYASIALSFAYFPAPVVASALAFSSAGGALGRDPALMRRYWALGWLLPMAGDVLMSSILVLLPLRVIYPLSIGTARKVKAAAVLSASGLVLVPAVARLVAGSAPSHADCPWHWDTPVDALYRVMEAGLGITLACAPYMEPPPSGASQVSRAWQALAPNTVQISWLTTARHIRTACVGRRASASLVPFGPGFQTMVCLWPQQNLSPHQSYDRRRTPQHTPAEPSLTRPWRAVMEPNVQVSGFLWFTRPTTDSETVTTGRSPAVLTRRILPRRATPDNSTSGQAKQRTRAGCVVARFPAVAFAFFRRRHSRHLEESSGRTRAPAPAQGPPPDQISRSFEFRFPLKRSGIALRQRLNLPTGPHSEPIESEADLAFF